ncbi:MAG TPA: hypothetical protein VMS96_07195 [Terriglobales bacterium]|nr:hypothetical protein [Terriglobales bacterium]
MKKWYMPLAVLGIGSLGALLLSERGRQALRWVAESIERHQDTILEWNEAAERELDRLEEALDRIAASIEGTEEAR